MNNISKIPITQSQILGEWAMLMYIAESKKFEGGRYTDEINGYKVTVASVLNDPPEMHVVKVQDKPEISNEQIRSSFLSNKPITVCFDGFIGRMYINSQTNSPAISCKAKSVKVINIRNTQ